MSNPLNKVSELIEKKLQCYICFEQVGPDAVETVCDGRHTFCFSCISQHIASGITGMPTTAQLFPRDEDAPKCPVCRGGVCSIMPSQFLADLSNVMGDKRDRGADWLVVYKDLLPLLKRNFRLVFENYKFNSGVITCGQIRLFMYYKDRPADLIPVLQTSSISARQRRNAIYRPMPQTWAAVSINAESGAFVVSKHQTEEEAKILASNAPSSFDRAFVVAIYEDESLVMYQARPVQIFMSVGLDVENYFATTLPDFRSKRAIIRLLTRPEILNGFSHPRDGDYSAEGITHEENNEESWLPM